MYVKLGVNDSLHGNILATPGVLSGRLDSGPVMLHCEDVIGISPRKLASGNKNLIYSSGSLHMNQ